MAANWVEWKSFKEIMSKKVRVLVTREVFQTAAFDAGPRITRQDLIEVNGSLVVVDFWTQNGRIVHVSGPRVQCEKNMKPIRKLHEVVTACGNILRGTVEVNGLEYIIESDGEQWVNIISDGGCEACSIQGDDVVSDSGEHVTADWTEEDWKHFSEFCRKPENN